MTNVIRFEEFLAPRGSELPSPDAMCAALLYFAEELECAGQPEAAELVRLASLSVETNGGKPFP